MSQLVPHGNLNDGTTSRAYTGYPLNSTLVSSYTPDTIRSIITQAAAGQPYSTSVWIRINRAGIQITVQDPELARTRVPVFIPIGLAHDIYMLPSINNVICIIYDEHKSNMKGVLLYIIYPSDAQSLREDFRIVKQANNTQLPPTTNISDTRYSNAGDTYPSDNNQIFTPITTMQSPLSNDFNRNNRTVRQRSPRRSARIRENESYMNTNLALALPEPRFTPHRSDYHSGREDTDHRRHRSSGGHRERNSSSKRSSDGGVRHRRSHGSRSPEKQTRQKSPINNNNPEFTQEQIYQQQLQLQQQQQQQQQMAAWQSAQQMPLVPIGIYNRYVPKAIPLPTGEILKTTLPPGVNGAVMDGTATTYIEPQQLVAVRETIRSPSNSFQQPQSEQNGSLNPHYSAPIQTTHQRHHRHRHRRHHNNDNTYESPRFDPNLYVNEPQSSRPRSKRVPSMNSEDDETKQYLKLLVDEMQAMKLEMSKLRQTSVSTPKPRSDSIHADLKDIRSHIDVIRARMAMTPR